MGSGELLSSDESKRYARGAINLSDAPAV